MTQKIDAIDARDAPLDVVSVVEKPIHTISEDNYYVFTAVPTTGILYIINNFPEDSCY